jgi:hypothetical protein
VPGEDLTSIPGLEEAHRRALDRKLGITTLHALADADRRKISTALRGTRPYASLIQIDAWQDYARLKLSDAATDKPGWQTAASFAVIFSQRQVGDVWERRLVAEQTEKEPAPELREWPSWDCGLLCDWMLGHLTRPDDEADSEADAARQTGTATEPTARAAPARAQWAELRIDSATITDALQQLDLIRAGNVITAPPGDLELPARLSLTVSGGRSGQHLQAAVWLRRRSGPGWSPQAPVSVPRSGRAEFDLSSIPPGEHEARLVAWATEPGATLATVALPKLTFRPAAE